MKIASLFLQGVSLLTAAAICIPITSLAAESSHQPLAAAVGSADADRQIDDISLSDNGLLIGRVLNSERQPQIGVDVAIYSANQPVAATRTDANGAFAVAGLRGGVHQIVASTNVRTCRLWAAGTAPPNAANAAHITSDSAIARGQWGPPPLTNQFVRKAKVLATNPFIIGGAVAAAVAIPVAIHNADQDDGPSS
jgi:hypothetical protein